MPITVKQYMYRTPSIVIASFLRRQCYNTLRYRVLPTVDMTTTYSVRPAQQQNDNGVAPCALCASRKTFPRNQKQVGTLCTVCKLANIWVGPR